MQVAVENNNPDVINLLISAGADVDAIDDVSTVLIQYLTNHYLTLIISLSYTVHMSIISLLSSWYES